MDVERRLQALCQQRLRRSDQQNIGLVISHVTLSIYECASRTSKFYATKRNRSPASFLRKSVRSNKGPHPEERALARVSKDGSRYGQASGYPSRRPPKRAASSG